ncbi:MAG TPA: PepSY-associated TM helix domain-containing protein [Burkholderiales bacterium]|nr:PepSY-associated TM helix domain-containing protein [Burkholderiales bacterium]
MRAAWVVAHRWIGLAMAAFLVLTGVTGAIISWDHELDDLLNPHLLKSASKGEHLSPLSLLERFERENPKARVTFAPLAPEPGDSLALFITPRVDPATGRQHELGYNQVFIDPVSGRELGRREWGGVWPITRENVVSFLYKLHFSLHLPEMWGIDRWGQWLLGAIALAWTLDCFIGFYLTLPRGGTRWWQRWKPAWRVRTAAGARLLSYKLNFDLHRAGGLWTWGLLVVIAFTAFSLNLFFEVFYPAMSKISQLTPTPFHQRAPLERHSPIEPRLSYAQVVEKAKDEAGRRGWKEPAGSAFYAPEWGIYGVQFFHPGDDHGAAGVGPARLYYDGIDGRYLGDLQPWKGTAADIFVQAQFPVHSGRILGLPGRILISIMGLVVAALSVTGVVIWWRKRRAAALRSATQSQPQASHAHPTGGEEAWLKSEYERSP